jgi:hypothetical protein
MDKTQNSFALLAQFNREARKAGFSDEWVKAKIKEATATDRDNLERVLDEAFNTIKQ